MVDERQGLLQLPVWSLHGNDMHSVPLLVTVAILAPPYDAFGLRVESVVFAHSDIVARMPLETSLTSQDLVLSDFSRSPSLDSEAATR